MGAETGHRWAAADHRWEETRKNGSGPSPSSLMKTRQWVFQAVGLLSSSCLSHTHFHFLKEGQANKSKASTVLSQKRTHNYLPELQTAQLQRHAFTDLAGIALHVVIPELMGERSRVRLMPSFFLPGAETLGGKHTDASWPLSLVYVLVV